MLTRPIFPPLLLCQNATLEFNSSEYQVLSYLNGGACELLKKTRTVSDTERVRVGLSLHDCYPSVFMQDEAAVEFLAELRAAASKYSADKVGCLMLSAYDEVLH